MKKILLLLLMVGLLITGCSKYDEKDALNDFDKKVSKLKSYYLDGKLEIVNDENIYTYDVQVSYKKDDYYKVSLTNVSNNHEQIILKNTDGVFVVTPSLNKSFRFQSDWPYSNSQIYLLQSILNDIKTDNNKTFTKEKDKYIFTTEVNYPNNRKLVRQDIIFNKKMKLKEIKVYNEDDVAIMTMKFNKIDYNHSFNKKDFQLDEVMSTVSDVENTTSMLEESIYPLNLPDGTKLVSEDKLENEDITRVIMTFDGEKPFLLVEETAKKMDEMTIIPTNGEPYLLQDSYGILSNNSLNWTSAGVEYYLVSDVLNQDELISVAESISVIPTMK